MRRVVELTGTACVSEGGPEGATRWGNKGTGPYEYGYSLWQQPPTRCQATTKQSVVYI